jgi:hypothetical protein
MEIHICQENRKIELLDLFDKRAIPIQIQIKTHGIVNTRGKDGIRGIIIGNSKITSEIIVKIDLKVDTELPKEKWLDIILFKEKHGIILNKNEIME